MISPTPRPTYKVRLHSAVRTDDYTFSQLIPYIGNKRKLLPLISRAIEATGADNSTFVDLFTGSTVVARMAKSHGLRVLANDWEPYSYEIAYGTVALNLVPPFAMLGGVEAVFNELNSVSPVEGYITAHLCPRDDENPDHETERMFFTRANGMRIDAMREAIAEWERSGRLSDDERAYIMAAFMYAVSYASNTSGVFKGFHHGWGGKTGTALYRIRGHLTLRPPVTLDNGCLNKATREDAGALTRHLADELGSRPDIVYIDPPYNQHPYGSNYHVLNTVVLWDKPPLNASIQVNGRKHDKSAIRKDWRTERRSAYNSKSDALPAFRRLLSTVDARWLLVSYSTDGNMPLRGLLSALLERGSVSVLVQKYKRYRVSTPRMSPKSHNVEFVAVVDTEEHGLSTRLDELENQILNHEALVLGADRATGHDQLVLL